VPTICALSVGFVSAESPLEPQVESNAAREESAMNRDEMELMLRRMVRSG
jgi:hypothetical protein